MSLIMSILLCFFNIFTAPVPDYTLTVEIVNFRNTNGQLILVLYNEAVEFEDASLTAFYQKQVVDFDSKATVRVSFENLKSGQYAIKVLHDENEDGKLNRLFFKPNEGLGVSNFKTINLTNRPNFEKAAFEMSEDKTLKIKLIYL